jgi:hypothetical protein
VTRVAQIRPEFVEHIPDVLEDGVLYVSMNFATAMHKCCCGCGREVVTPLTPTDWAITYNGASISVSPSIGNWSFECQSHYWIEESHVRWAGRWTPERIAQGRAADRAAKDVHFGQLTPDTVREPMSTSELGLWQKLKRLLGRKS